MSSKRARASQSNDSLSSSASSNSPTPTIKQQRVLADSDAHPPLLCTLPPTCNPPRNKPTSLANTRELEAHYATYHAHVCEEHGCGAVFPDARLFELHQTECHDPIAAIRKERGEKIFACHLAACGRTFSTPKTRRLHLIQAHAYPKEYFFAVTNKGVGGLLKKWGEGANLVRGQWKRRDTGDDAMEEDSESEREVEDVGECDMEDAFAQPAMMGDVRSANAAGVDELSSTLNALSLVPSSIRFGRGGKSARDAASNGHASRRPAQPTDFVPPNIARGRGRGRVGRGAPYHASAHLQPQPSSYSNSETLQDKDPVGDEEPVSINIDAALDALKQEPIQSDDRVVNRGPGQNFDTNAGYGRGRGRGAGRGRAYPRGRGRGFVRGL